MVKRNVQRKAYSYLRFSSPEQANGDSFRRQSAMAVDYAKIHNLNLDESLTFHDLGVSAYQGANSETGQLSTLLEAVHTGLIPQNSVILVESLDRISRQSARKALRVIEGILEAGVSLITLNDEREYTVSSLDTDPLSLMMALLTFIRANEESTMKSLRVAAAWETKRRHALEKIVTSKCPGWLELAVDKKSFNLNPIHTRTIQRIFSEILAGKSMRDITRRLNIDSVPLQHGGGRQAKFWQITSVCLILRNPAVIGTYTPKACRYVEGKKIRFKYDPIRNYYPSAISEEDFKKVQCIRNASNPKGFGRPQRDYPVFNIFGRLARCASCGSAMIFSSRSQRSKYILCRKTYLRAGCLQKSIRYNDIEALAFARFPDLLREVSVSLTPFIQIRFQKVRDMLMAKDVSRKNINLGLRSLLKSIEIDASERTVNLKWQSGIESLIPVPPPNFAL
jgi:DNA invertase Pin-like site-specific DNA recombinase